MHLSGDAERLLQLLDGALRSECIETLGIAVSGGSDSVALLHLAAEHARGSGLGLKAVTVDHGLRPDSAAEAELVAAQCQSLGIQHTVLNWQGWDGSGNLQDQARRARYGLMAGWARTEGVTAIALAHTADDQAETFLMRLAREAGIDGLSGMAERRVAHDILWLRPLLSVERQRLRDYLAIKGIGWTDDPSNEDTRFDRIKARQILAALAPLGIDASGLSAVAANIRSVRHALDLQAQAAAESIASFDAGDVVFQRDAFAALPTEIGRRLLVHAIKWVGSAEYGPRGPALTDAYSALLDGRGSTLHGCRLLDTKSGLRVTREFQSVKNETAAPDAVWDGRWLLSGPENKGLTIRPLGDAGLRGCGDWRATGRPRASLLASPAVWRDQQLVAAPLAGMSGGWTANLIHPENHFISTIISH